MFGMFSNKSSWNCDKFDTIVDFVLVLSIFIFVSTNFVSIMLDIIRR